MVEQNSAGATNSSTSASRRASRPGHLPRVLLATVMPAAAEPSFLRQRSVEVGGQAGLAARRLVEGRGQASFEVAAHQGLPGFGRREAAARPERDRKRVVSGTRVSVRLDLRGRLNMKKKKKK